MLRNKPALHKPTPYSLFCSMVMAYSLETEIKSGGKKEKWVSDIPRSLRRDCMRLGLVQRVHLSLRWDRLQFPNVSPVAHRSSHGLHSAADSSFTAFGVLWSLFTSSFLMQQRIRRLAWLFRQPSAELFKTSTGFVLSLRGLF